MKVEKNEAPIPMQELKTLELDIEKGTLKVNGSDYSNVSFFSLIFEHGVFKLSFRSEYFADGKKSADFFSSVKKEPVPTEPKQVDCADVTINIKKMNRDARNHKSSSSSSQSI